MRRTVRHELFECGVSAGERTRTRRVVDAVAERLQRAGEAEHLAVRLGEGAAFRIEQRAAAEGHDVPLPRTHVGESLFFTRAEPRLAFLCKNLRN